MAATQPIRRVTEGAPEPLGARLVAEGLNVAVWSGHAAAVEICLFDEDGQVEIERITLPGRTGPVFHGCIAGVGVGARYGLRAHGPYDPANGHRFNPAKLLVDPYALALDRPFALHPSMFGYDLANPEEGSSFDAADSAPFVPKAIVTLPPEPTPPGAAISWDRTVIYELHVRGFTRLHPDVPPALRGTFAGLAHPAAVAHLKRLGVSTVELMPSAAWIDERHLPPLGLSNYWGYNPIAFLAPDPRLAPGGWSEVRAATEALAAAGIETVLDVVFNHTGEGDALGPTVSLRGLDNASYYQLDPADSARYVNDAGTGDILALDRPAPMRLTMDALRAWRRYGGVTGFRFDLASVLARRADGFDPAAPLLMAIDQDPELRGLKRIAEPWDCGPGGYQLGAFPAAWGEWNDRFRDSLRGFWRGDAISLGELARRLAGSEDVFAGRAPSRSVNFVVAHDGLTLADLVACAAKHNEANGEDNRDGTDDNRSWNNGVEGPTDDPAVLAARRRDQKALLALLLLARGTPMLAMGAELSHSQGGNNNAYAQDNAISWLDWGTADQTLIDFTARLIAVRQAHPALHADRHLTGQPRVGCDALPDVDWRRADGAGLAPADWDDPAGEILVMALAETAADGPDRVIVVIHRGGEPAEIVLPEPRDGFEWRVEVDSGGDDQTAVFTGQDRLWVPPRTVLALVEASAPLRRPREVDDRVLARLAQAAGISLDWWGVDGQRHQVGADSLSAILGAMDLEAATSQLARAALVRLADAFDRRAVPLKQIARAGEAAPLALAFGAGTAPPRTWLNIEDERGELRHVRVGDGAGSETRIVCRDGRTASAVALDLPALPLGRYRLWRDDRPDVAGALTIAPPACYLPEAFKAGRRAFALSAQIYTLRRDGDQGVGDFTTLGELGAAAAREGAAMLCINPMHAQLDGQRDHASPYYPSDRRFLDPLYLDLGEVPFAADFARQAAELTRLDLIDYPAVWALKSAALEASFTKAKKDPELAVFIAEGGESLARFAAFQAIAETRLGEPWSRWPADLRRVDGAGVGAFAAGHADRVRFHQYLQWLCEAQMARAAERSAGLSLGFCRDLAVGAAPDGAEAWAYAGLIAQGVSIGAPPDPIGPQGQVWGLPPFDPHKLRADGCRAMGELFAANMRHAGALRIDHVMGLARQFWVPAGAQGADGAYVAFPLDDLLGELTLESVRARRLVVGEDLGTVPAGLREKLAESAVLSYRVAPFEREGSAFKRPAAYPALAMACVATHDLPPLAGWWDGVDIKEREALALYTPEQAERARLERRADRRGLIQVLKDEGLVAETTDLDGDLDQVLAAAIHAFVAATPSCLAAAQVDDLVGERIAVNLPGTHVERANWRRRLAAPLGGLMDGPLAQAILGALRAGRV